MKTTVNSKTAGKIITCLVFCAVFILLGLMGMLALASMKKPPAEVRHKERPLQVTAFQAETEDVPVVITGYGEVKPLNIISVASEVSGKIITIHPRLEPGEIVQKGDLLFKIDPRNYLAAKKESAALAGQLNNTITRLKKQLVLNQKRLKTLERNRKLARAEYERFRKLFYENNVGSRSKMESSEQAANSAKDMADQMAQTIELCPIQIRESKNSLAGARAKLEAAEADLKRCEVYAPFKGRIKDVSLENGQYVISGQNVLTLADDSVLEILVPLDSRDVRQWLRFSGEQSLGKMAWFSDLDSAKCKIRWTEALQNHNWEGVLDRVVKFDQNTRTITVAIRIKAEQALSGNSNRLPLVEGMFCLVSIPGKTMYNIVRLPRSAVSFKKTVYVVKENRLRTVSVKVVRIQDEYAFVSKGLSPGDQVITTRLVNPIENSLLTIVNQDKKQDERRMKQS